MAKARKTGEWPWSAYTIAEFCQQYRISRTELYREWKRKRGPRRKPVGQRGWIITVEAAKEWAAKDERSNGGLAVQRHDVAGAGFEQGRA